VRAAAENYIQSHSTFVVNAPRISVGVPYAPQCWSFDPADTVDVTSLPAAFSERTVVVWVHGFRQNFLRTVEIIGHLKHRLQESSAAFGSNGLPVVIGFLWPAYSQKLSYAHARGNAWSAAPRLKALLEALRLRCCRVVVIGHSLGCKLSLEALHRSNATTGDISLRDSSLCSHLILVSAAVPSDALSPGGRYPRSHVAAQQVTVISSEHDIVLRKYFAVGETASRLLLKAGSMRHPAALGHVGPASPVPPEVHCLRARISHNENSALASIDVQRCIVAAASGVAFLAPSSFGGLSVDSWSRDVDVDNVTGENFVCLEDDNLDTQLCEISFRDSLRDSHH